MEPGGGRPEPNENRAHQVLRPLRRRAEHVRHRWPGAALSRGTGVVPPRDTLPEDSPGDRFLAALAILAAGAFALMLVWLVGR